MQILVTGCDHKLTMGLISRRATYMRHVVVKLEVVIQNSMIDMIELQQMF